jgi:hypothetical protein
MLAGVPWHSRPLARVPALSNTLYMAHVLSRVKKSYFRRGFASPHFYARRCSFSAHSRARFPRGSSGGSNIV